MEADAHALFADVDCKIPAMKPRIQRENQRWVSIAWFAVVLVSSI